MIKRINNAVENQNLSEVAKYSKEVVARYYESRISDLSKSEREQEKQIKKALKSYKENQKTKLTEKELKDKNSLNAVFF